MHEIQLKGSHAMKLDALVQQYKLSERQKLVLESLLEREGDFKLKRTKRFARESIDGLCKETFPT